MGCPGLTLDQLNLELFEERSRHPGESNVQPEDTATVLACSV